MITTREYPHDDEAERALLGACMLDQSRIGECVDAGLEAAHFNREDHGRLWSLLCRLDASGEVVDLVTVGSAVAGERPGEYGGASYVVSLTRGVPASAAVSSYARIVMEHADRRRLLEVTENVVAEALRKGERPEALWDKLSAAAMDRPVASSGFASVASEVDGVIGGAQDAYDNPDRPVGIPTGLFDLDQTMGGLHGGDLIVLAARPAMGKSALAFQVAESVAEPGRNVAAFSLEMGRKQITQRGLSAAADVDGRLFRNGQWRASELARLDAARDEYKRRTATLHIDDTTGITITQILSRCRRLERQVGPLSLVVIDYLQLMTPEDASGNRNNQITAMSRGAKVLAKELDVPVILLSQVNRNLESRQDKRPIMSDLRESGAIEQDADVILFLYRDEYYNEDSPDLGIAEVIVAKNRAGVTGTVKLAFQPRITRFRDLADEDSPIALD